MIYLAVDDEPMALEMLCDAISEADPGCMIQSYQDSSLALEAAKSMPFDAAFLDVQMGRVDGVTLARELKLINPHINLIFATAYQDYMLNAFDLSASDYLLKPITAAKVRKALDNLRYRPAEVTRPGLYFQCFGYFEVFCDGVPIKFKYEKSKEALAYLFDRQGSMCSSKALYSVLWEEEGHESYFKQVRRSLLSTLEEHGLSGLIQSRRGTIWLNMSMLESDYNDWQAGKPAGLNAYRGEYMAQYSWAEFTNGMMFSKTMA